MRKIAIIILSVLLAAAIISGFILYGEYRKTEDALLLSEKKRSSLDEKIIQLHKEKAVLQNQTQEKDEYLEKQRNAMNRISELKNAITTKDRSISDFQDKLLKLRKDSEEKEKIIAALRSELASKDTLISDLKEKLEITRSQLASLKNEMARSEKEIEMLRRNLADIQGESTQLRIRLDQIKSAHSDIVSELQSQIQNKEVTIVELEEKLSITFLDRVLFKSGRATITSEGRDILRRVGDILTKVRDKQIRVVGHTDNKAILPEYRNKFPSNWELSAARAGAVVRYFQKEIGLDPKNMEAVGRSFYEPIASNRTEEGRAQNRRVNVIIAPKIEPEK
jgi:chemotaxis protein MotB